MKAAANPSPLPSHLSGPAMAVLVTLAGAAVVAIGLLLVGLRETKVGQWGTGVPAITLESAR